MPLNVFIIASYSEKYLFYIEVFVLFALLFEKLKITELLYLLGIFTWQGFLGGSLLFTLSYR